MAPVEPPANVPTDPGPEPARDVEPPSVEAPNADPDVVPAPELSVAALDGSVPSALELDGPSAQAVAPEKAMWLNSRDAVTHSEPCTIFVGGGSFSLINGCYSESGAVFAPGQSISLNTDCGGVEHNVAKTDWVISIKLLTLPSGFSSFMYVLPTFVDGGDHFTTTLPTLAELSTHGILSDFGAQPVVIRASCEADEGYEGPGFDFGNLLTLIDATATPPPPPPTNHPPVASFDPPASTGTPGSFQFVSTSTDPDSGDTLSYDWDFGDGSTHAIGATNTHAYTVPGTYTAKLTVTDSHSATSSATRPVVVKAPDLGVTISMPGRITNVIAPNATATARVTVSASGDGVGDLSALHFVGPSLEATGTVETVDATTPADFTLAPGTSQTFDTQVHATSNGKFTLNAKVTGQDAANRVVGPAAATLHGNVSPLVVTLESQGDGTDSIELVMAVSNESDDPISGLNYAGTGGVTLRPELVPQQLRGGVTLASGPTPALPSTLGPGETARATFRFTATATGSVVVVGQAAGNDANGTAVTGAGVGQLDVSGSLAPVPPKRLTDADVADFLATMWQRGAQQDAAGADRLHQAAQDLILRRLQQVEGIDNVRLIAEATAGLLEGWASSAGVVLDAAGKGVGYVGHTLATSPFQLWIDASYGALNAAQSTKGAVDSTVYGLASQVANAYYAQESNVNTNGYVPLPGPTIDGTVAQAELEYAKQMALSQAASEQRVDAAIRQLTDDISADPYNWARSLTKTVGKGTGEVILAEIGVRGGTALVGATVTAVEAAKAEAEVLAAARRLVAGSGALEALGENAVITLEQLEALGGITQGDAKKVDAIIKAAKTEFGVDLELQARPSNPYSTSLLDAGALGKTEILKVKSLTDVDVIIGADPKALGKVGVFNPKLPSAKVLDQLPAGLRDEVQARFELQAKSWAEWNDPSSKLAKSFEKASQPGGATFSFDTPTAAGDPTASTREIFLEARANSAYTTGETVTFQSKARGGSDFVDIASDIDWQAALQVTGDTTKTLNRDRFNLWLNDQFRKSGIAYGEHGVTVNAFDWKGIGTDVKETKAWLGFILESLPADQARALAETWAAKLRRIDPSVTADFLLEKVTTGKFVIKFRSDSVFVGSTAIP